MNELLAVLKESLAWHLDENDGKMWPADACITPVYRGFLHRMQAAITQLEDPAKAAACVKAFEPFRQLVAKSDRDALAPFTDEELQTDQIDNQPTKCDECDQPAAFVNDQHRLCEEHMPL